MSHSRDDARVRLAARLVAALLATPDAGLERFRDRRLGDMRLQAEDLRAARDVLDAVGFALAGTDRKNWQRLRQAWEILRRNTPPEVAEPTPAPHPARAAETERSPRGGSRPSADAIAPSVQVGVVSAPTTAPATAFHPPAAARAPVDAGRSTGSPWAERRAAEISGDDELDATRGIDALLVAQVALPFSREAKAAPPPALTDEAHPDAGATSLAIPTINGDGLPFSSTQESAAVEPADDLDGTRDIVALTEEDPLPFKSSAASSPASSLVDDETHPDAGATSFMIPTLSIDDDLPFDTTPNPPVELTLGQYVSFVVDCEEASDPRVVQQEYRIVGDDAAKKLAEHWRRRLAESAAEREEFDRLVAAYRDWLHQSRRNR
jgi:hypothetical protein